MVVPKSMLHFVSTNDWMTGRQNIWPKVKNEEMFKINKFRQKIRQILQSFVLYAKKYVLNFETC
ncbi:hypothetical protein BpHYR1_040132 [Brachionus plicatilis]|uniref:Uncharacterized protein n=1 Tax=Brachionus plicatilis TaxID=10195 RepID=A0A3M7RBW6_BRAPC|nr:hypothetical protein BpHYR1_040132 [Brachionus plicatilis]